MRRKSHNKCAAATKASGVSSAVRVAVSAKSAAAQAPAVAEGPAASQSASPGRRGPTPALSPEAAEHERWMAKYAPVEREVIEAHASAIAARSRVRPRDGRAYDFAALCEASEGRAVRWRRDGCTDGEIAAFVNEDWFVLDVIVPLLHMFGLGEEDVLRCVPRESPLAVALHLVMQVCLQERAYFLCWALLALLRGLASMRIDRFRVRARRPLYYAQERERRERQAAERRKVVRRATLNPCPSRDEVLDAWVHVRDSKESLLRFGSLMQDLECHVDNSLQFDDEGCIAGRNRGVKGWLEENIPALALRYTSVIRYKAAAKKLRQAIGLGDPVPLDRVVDPAADEPDLAVVRARAVYLEAMGGTPDVAARVLARIDALCDPERIEEATILSVWRERYASAITLRMKNRWWRKMRKRSLGERSGLNELRNLEKRV